VKGKKFKYKPFMELLQNHSSLKMEEQKNKLDEAIENWKGDIEQNDDICIIGIKI
jgi:serine phosphatase RsbU (regulator of sigma subunit)